MDEMGRKSKNELGSGAEPSGTAESPAEDVSPQEVEDLRAERNRLAAVLEKLEERLGIVEITQLGPQEKVEWVWARRPFGYCGETIDRGQIFRLKGARLDGKLIDIGYAQKLEKHAERFQCGECGKEFVGMEYRTAHGDLRHQNRCVCGQAFAMAEALRQHQRICPQWQAGHRSLTPPAGLEQSPPGVGTQSA